MITPRQRTRADGTVVWQVMFRHGGKQTSETFADPKAAARFAKLLADLGPAEALAVLEAWQVTTASTATTLGAFALEHVESLTGVGDGYRQRCRRMIGRDLATMAHLPIDAITPATVSQWVNAMEKAGASGKTIKNKHGFLSAVLAHAVRDQLIPSNPCAGTRLPRTVAPSMTFLTHEEYARFLGFFTPHWQPMVTLMFSTGARFSELTALTVADVDLEAATASITKAWKDNGARIGPPKSKKSVRTLSLAPETVEVLRPLVAGRPADALVLINQLGGAVRLQTFHDNVWGPAVRLANGEPAQKGKRVGRRLDAAGRVIEPATAPLGKRPRPHDARHTCASWLLGAGVPINYVQAHLGHESITTTVDRYGHIMPAARQAVALALSAALTTAHPQIEG
ncbi:MAG: tyrosine-type recombinase/integrase [Nocardioides sp.]